jgi:hypothetical protein
MYVNTIATEREPLVLVCQTGPFFDSIGFSISQKEAYTGYDTL